jgi:cell division protein FtsL
MRALLYILGIGAFLALAGLSYSQNYATRDVLDQVDDLRAEIVAKQKQLRALEDEWAYLNRPQRIKALAVLNYPHIMLMKRSPAPPAEFSDLPFLPDPSDYDPSLEVLQ